MVRDYSWQRAEAHSLKVLTARAGNQLLLQGRNKQPNICSFISSNSAIIVFKEYDTILIHLVYFVKNCWVVCLNMVLTLSSLRDLTNWGVRARIRESWGWAEGVGAQQVS